MTDFSKRQLSLINLSLNIIISEGIQSLTIKNLSAKAKISEPAIYRHFNSKFDILYNILVFFEEQSSKYLGEIKESNLPEVEKLKSFFLTTCKRFNTHKAFALIMFSEEIFSNDIKLKEKLLTIISKQKKVLISIIIEAQKNNIIVSDIPEEHIFTLIIGYLRFIVTQWKMNNFEKNLEEIGKEYWSSLEQYFGNK
jgi:AcrR family transcriptional regulator